ncbi:hypothetical protein AMS68_000164 [Peltaster fructicola]|uniref:Enhancer of mRNA-decapping protein 3 n=1 Tax=Peltaster fructicola TaxID=286661 RepID=A0A6H0XIU6_9PEZI|nr:hypothetical protein AMS68_000164 [Peltaster fructicola]
MAGFVGAIVQITLKQPPNTIVQGRVQEVVPGQALHLEDVLFPQNGTRWPQWTVQNGIIADLNVLQTSQAPPAVQLPIRPAPSHPTPPQIPAQNSQHVDPAILSFHRTPAQQSSGAFDSSAATPTKSMPPIIAPKQQTPQLPTPSNQAHAGSSQGVDLRKVFEAAQAGEKGPKKRQRPAKQQRAVKPESTATEPLPVINTEVSRNGNDMNGAAKRGKGWRETPLLHSAEAEAGQSKRRRRQRQIDGEAQNGWATEDATDIQDMGEFDFEANHKLFNKEQVFEQLRKDDTTADEDRLVSHNKLPPRKNLLPTEMVLSPRLADGSDADTEVDFQTGRSSSRHSISKRQASRVNSGYLDRPHPLSASMSSERAASRASRSKPTPVLTGNMLRSNEPSPRSTVSRKSRAERHEAAQTHFILATSKALCPVLLPEALQTLEDETSQYGVSADAITELAARCIAEETLRLAENPGEVRRPSRTNTARATLSASTTLGDASQPVIVILAGNHSTGARALAATRHLVSRKYKIIIAEGIFETAAVQDQQFARQHQALKKCIRAGARIKRGSWRKAQGYIKGLPGPPVAIIDALFAGTTYDDLLAQTEDLNATALEDAHQIIDWANRSRAPVISITCPSGVNGYDGSAAIVDGEPLAVRPDKVLSLGAPVTGILEAMKGGEHWDVSVADIGINTALKPEDAVEFGAQWVAAVMLSTA